MTRDPANEPSAGRQEGETHVDAKRLPSAGRVELGPVARVGRLGPGVGVGGRHLGERRRGREVLLDVDLAAEGGDDLDVVDDLLGQGWREESRQAREEVDEERGSEEDDGGRGQRSLARRRSGHFAGPSERPIAREPDRRTLGPVAIQSRTEAPGDSQVAWRTTLSPVGPAAFWAAASADWAPFWALSTYWATSGECWGVEAYDRRRAA